MKWSRYNHMFQSPKYGWFIYNATTNSFIKISQSLHERITAVKEWDNEISDFDKEFANLLVTNKIIVDEYADNKVLFKKKFIKYLASFNPATVSLTIATTTNCNFRCPYCFEEGVRPINMKEEVEDAIIAYISEQTKPMRITWYGGEPLMNFGCIERLTKRITEIPHLKYVEYAVITNGYFLDEEKCKFFSKTNVNLIQVTIDGNEHTHNNTRISKDGKPSFWKIIGNVDTALKLLPNCNIAIRVNIGKNNRDDYPQLYKALKEKWKEYKNLSIYFSFINDYGEKDPVCLTSSEKMAYARELYHKHGIPVPLAIINDTGVCNANSTGSYLVSPNGDLYKCWTDVGKPQKKVGTIFEPHKPTNFDLLTRYYVTDKFNDPQCLECFLLPICGGGCAIRRYTYLNKGQRENVCPYDFKDIDSTLEIMYEMVEKAKEKLHKKKFVDEN